MSDDVLFSSDGDQESDSENSDLEDRVEELEDRVRQLENQVLPSIRRVSTDNGDRFIVEQGAERWYKPETLKKKFERDNNE